MTDKQKIFILIPFFGSEIYLLIEFITAKRGFLKSQLAMLPAVFATFLAGAIMMIIGLISPSLGIFIIIPIVLLGIFYNLVFFTVLNKMNNKEK